VQGGEQRVAEEEADQENERGEHRLAGGDRVDQPRRGQGLGERGRGGQNADDERQTERAAVRPQLHEQRAQRVGVASSLRLRSILAHAASRGRVGGAERPRTARPVRRRSAASSGVLSSVALNTA
jgi:hypothetical protein